MDTILLILIFGVNGFDDSSKAHIFAMLVFTGFLVLLCFLKIHYDQVVITLPSRPTKLEQIRAFFGTLTSHTARYWGAFADTLINSGIVLWNCLLNRHTVQDLAIEIGLGLLSMVTLVVGCMIRKRIE